MTRAVDEWFGKSPNDPIPARVKLRIYTKFNGRCTVCTRKVGAGGIKFEFHHDPPLILGGENRESLITLVCVECHKNITKENVAEKSAIYKKRLKHLGIKRRKGKPMIGSKDSGWKKTFSGGWVKR